MSGGEWICRHGKYRSEHWCDDHDDHERRCRIEMVDGEPVRVQGGGEWDARDREAFTEIVRAAKRKFADDAEETA